MNKRVNDLILVYKEEQNIYLEKKSIRELNQL